MRSLSAFSILGICCFFFINISGVAFAQIQNSASDSLKIKYPFSDSRILELKPKPGFSLPNPSNIQRSVDFDPVTKRYIIQDKIGDKPFRAPQYLSIDEYQKYESEQIKRKNWKQLSDEPIEESREPGFVPAINIKSKSFERIFGGSIIDIRPQGSADLTLAGRINKNENPLFNERQRKQGSFDFDQRIQMNVVGRIGEKLRISTNYNTEAQFDFENQMKLDYTGKPDEIIQKIEAGNVSLPLSSTLITGSQALFGLKTQLQFGRLNVTSIFSQQRSQPREINISNGSQQNEFRIGADNYEANKHYFLAQYFRENYNKSLQNIPMITSNTTISKIEVWVTNRSNSTTDSRDVLAFMDLGENNPYNKTLFQGGGSRLPAGFLSPGFDQQSNNLLRTLPPDARLTNSNNINTYFQSTGGTDNYSKLTYARKLTEREFTLNARLGYISLNAALNADEVLAVAYRYNANGIEYQVGEFSSDVPVDPNAPQVLFTKLLKNEILKVNLPSWDLMMKNIYSLGAYQVSRNAFNFNIFRLEEKSGVEQPVISDASSLNGKLWIQATNLDNLNQVGDSKPDGFFDFIDGVTIDPLNGRITFPLVEPFGSDLAKKFNPVTEKDLIEKYVFQPLYDSTRVSAQQLFTRLNRYIFKGTYQSEVSSEFQLNAINVPPGSVQVTAGTLPLSEGADFTVDYNSGRVRILNQALLSSGQQIKIKMENNELFGLQQRSLFGSRFDYRVSDKLNLGGTFMNLSEKPLTPKINIGEEAISNTIFGMDANYSSDSRWLTKMVDKLPFLSTKEKSSITFTGEFAKLIPGHPRALNFAGSKNGASYLDDFEGSRSIIDIKSPVSWQISGTPQLFPESKDVSLNYGYNRAKLAFYTIDPIFFNRNNNLTPDNIKNNRTEQSNHYVREVIEQEVFPFKQAATGQNLTLPTFDLAYYPTLRGPYNYTTTGVNPNGTLNNPRNRWGGIFRRLESTDFESLNIEFIEMWVMDPFIYKPGATGGDLYFNLGSVSEDILKDGRKALENGLPGDGNQSKTDETIWGRVPKLQPVIQAFDNDPAARRVQDVGLDGLSSTDERQFFSPFLSQLNPQAASQLQADPSSDDFQYYRGSNLDNINAGILKRYERYNGTEGNSKTNEQSQQELGIDNSAATALPDGEDINRDNNSSLADEYFQYKVSIRPQDMIVGQNFITDKVISTVKLANGLNQQVAWYQFKIPIAQGQKVGNIQDFKSIRFARMFLTDFADTTILRMARLQLVRGEWRRYNGENSPAKAIVNPLLGANQGLDNSQLDVSTVNIEDNGRRVPIPYVVPPGIERERDFSNFRGDTRQNEQSLSLAVKRLRDGYGRAAFRTTFNDFRSYRRIEMFIHAEGAQLQDKDVNAFLRIGTDNQDNYYQYEIPLKVTVPGSKDANAIWPEVNKMDLELKNFQTAKARRNDAVEKGTHPGNNVPFTYDTGNGKITILGQPDLSKVRIYMVGVNNPLQGSISRTDDGLEKDAEVWFNELRLTDFDERGGWAATARMNTKLADLGDITLSGSTSTIGFGSIDKKVSERNRSEDMFFDFASSLELGRFFPARAGIKIPVFFNFSRQLSTPQYDPRFQDTELKNSLDGLSRNERKNYLGVVNDFTKRRSINFTNVRKIKVDPDSKMRLWDIENLSATFAFTEFKHHDFITENDLQKTYRGGLAYNFSGQPKNYTPFDKLIKSKKLALIKDFNFSLLPSTLNFRTDIDRLYSERTLRNTPTESGPVNFLPIATNYNKNFQMNRLYGLGWDLTKSLKLDLNATNYSVVDEPEGRLEGSKRDSVWRNFKKLGRNTNYNHTINLNYTVPINKIPALSWTNLIARYGTNFNWTAEPLSTLRNDTLNFGNTIQNARTFQLNPSLNFVTLYNKFGFIRKANDPKNKGASKYFLGVLTGLKNLTGAYTKTEGTFLPGYLPQTKFLGYDFNSNAPGWDFILGSQDDIRGKAIRRNWLTTDTLMNQLYVNTKKEDLNIRGSIEPLADLRIELTATKSQSFNYSTNFKYSPSDPDANGVNMGFINQSPTTTGDFSISYSLLRTAFAKEDKNGASGLFKRFEENRAIISRRLGGINPNSTGTAGGFAEGYNKNSQDVVTAAFLAAYRGKDASNIKLNAFPKIPVPNWRLTYNGLTKYDFFNNLFASFDVNHTYRSSYNVNSFNSLARYREENGFSSLKDVNGNFLPTYQFSQITLAEQFLPLIGIDFRLKNNLTANFEYRKSRLLSLSLANSQLAQLNDNGIVFGFGFRTTKFRFPFGLFSGRKLSNDLNFKTDFALNDRKTVIYRADVPDPEVSSGSKNITIRPSLDYILNQKLNLRLFYDGNITKPYTSQTFNTSFSNFGVSLRFTLQ